MVKIEILQIAKTKDASVAALEADYEKRLSAFAQLSLVTLEASRSDERERAQAEECERFLAKLNPDAALLVLDERGKQLTSPNFAEWIREQRDFGPGQIQCLIGGSHGLNPALIAKADLHLSLSKMTFPHELIRPFFKEQLYRAFMILAGRRYHK